jgi:holin-like protein
MANQVLRGFTLLLLLQLAGEAISRSFHLPIPGPIVGFALAVIVLLLAPALRQPLTSAADAILSHLSLLFVPAGVGVVLYLREIAQDGVAIVAAILLSTWIGLGVTAWVAERCSTKDDQAPGTKP